MPKKIEWLVIHHTAVSRAKNPDQWKATNAEHFKRFNFPARNGDYGGYHIEIAANGNMHRFRDDDEVGAHCKEKQMNYKSIGICLDGNFDMEEPTIEQQRALLTLISEYQEKYHIPDENVVPHRYFATGIANNDTAWKTATGKKPYKTCWGSKLPDDIIGYLKQSTNELPPITGHWSDPFLAFMTEKGYIKDRKNPDLPVSWGELGVVIKRFYDDLISNPPST